MEQQHNVTQDLINPPNLEQILQFFQQIFKSEIFTTKYVTCLNCGLSGLKLLSGNNNNSGYTDGGKDMRKKLKNRESAQAARDRRKNRVVCLERQVTDLTGRNRFLENENRELKQRLQQYELTYLH